jgi:hypothetical protein
MEGLQPDPLPSPRPDRRPLLVAAAVVAVVVAVAAVALLGRDDGDGVSTDPSEVPRLVLDEAVVGLPASGALDLPVEGSELGAPITVTLYEAPAADGTDEVGVFTFGPTGDSDFSYEPSEGSEEITVRGEPAWFTDDELRGATVAWADDGGAVVSVGSHDLRRDELLAAVEPGTAADGGFVPGPAGPGRAAPERVGRSIDVDMSVSPMPAGAVGHGVAYSSDEELDRYAFLSVVAADEADLRVLRWLASADREVEVRGHPAWMSSRVFDTGSSVSGSDDSQGGGGSDGGDGGDETITQTESHTILWEEAPGVVATLTVTGYPADEALHLAEQGIVTATDREWAALVEAADSPIPEGAEAAVSGDDGSVSWSVYLDDQGEVCAAVQAASSSTEVCGSAVGGAEILTDDGGEQLAVYGALPEGAVDVRAGDGSPLGASTAPSEDGVVVYAITLDDGPPPAEVVFVDDAGREVSRIQVGSVPAIEEEPAG